ncbi:MAG: pyrimidine 5'-nucleotidase [Hyphomonadaceae bacterium]
MIDRDIDTWVFDLDNTLYPAPMLYDEIGERMTAYIARTLAIDRAEALRLREHYFHEYGATIVGLVERHGVDAGDFLRDVHTADHSVLTPDPELRALIGRLPGRRIIYTNGGGGHAERVLQSLNLTDVFDHVFDLESADLAPKPQRASYDRLVATLEIDTRGAILVEDTLRNLEPAYDMGFFTALVGPVHPEPKPTYLNCWAPEVKTLLRGWPTRPPAVAG